MAKAREKDLVGTGEYAFPKSWLKKMPPWMPAAIEEYPLTLPAPVQNSSNGHRTTQTVLDQITCAAVCYYIGLGATANVAANAAGVPASTVQGWMQKGRAYIESGDENIFTEFLYNVMRAKAVFQVSALESIKEASMEPKHWTAAAWLLERRYPLDWGQLRRVETKNETTVTSHERVVIYIPDNQRDGDIDERYIEGEAQVVLPDNRRKALSVADDVMGDDGKEVSHYGKNTTYGDVMEE